MFQNFIFFCLIKGCFSIIIISPNILKKHMIDFNIKNLIFLDYEIEITDIQEINTKKIFILSYIITKEPLKGLFLRVVFDANKIFICYNTN